MFKERCRNWNHKHLLVLNIEACAPPEIDSATFMRPNVERDGDGVMVAVVITPFGHISVFTPPNPPLKGGIVIYR
jgi:hypothetical protein